MLKCAPTRKAVLRNATVLMSLASLLILPSGRADSSQAAKGGSNMTNHEAWKLYENYLRAWNTNSIEERLEVASKTLNENIEYETPRHDLCTGRSQVIEDMATFHQKFPGGHFEIGDVSSHHDVALLTWVLVQADGKVFAQGHDQLTVDRNGKIAKLTPFAPSAKDPN
jgi:hypothetical protein